MKTRLQLIALALVLTTASAYAVTLTFYSDGQVIHTETVSQSNNQYSLASITAALEDKLAACREYTFVGWKEGSAVVEGETLTPISQVIPNADKSLYAVYERTKTNVVYRKYTETTMSAGDYVIAVQSGGNYYAMGNKEKESVLSDGGFLGFIAGTHIYSVQPTFITVNDADELDGEPEKAFIWSCKGSAGNWFFQNAEETNTYIYPRTDKGGFLGQDTYTYILGTSAALDINYNAENGGTWDIRRHNANDYLFYFNSEFIYDDSPYKFYLFKKVEQRISEYTSSPGCASTWTVHVHAGGGKFASTGATDVDLTETAVAGGVTLPVAVANTGNGCPWTFKGYVKASAPLAATSIMPFLIPAGEYKPSRDGEHLYAVYQYGEDGMYYERISSTSELSTDGIYVIATISGNNKAVTTTLANGSYFKKGDITTSGTMITSEVGANIQWFYDANGHFRGSNGTYLSSNDRNDGSCYKINGTGPKFKFAYENNYLSETTYKGWLTTYEMFGATKTQQEFYIYRQKSIPVEYNSTPHCMDVEIVEWKADGVVVESYVLDGTPALNGVAGTSNGDGTYTLSYAVSANPCKLISIAWDGQSTMVRTPLLVNTGTDMSTVADRVNDCSYCDMVVVEGGDVSVNSTATVRSLSVYPGGNFNLPSGQTFTTSSLTMLTKGDGMAPRATITGTFHCPTLNHDRRIDNSRKYWFALPYDVTISRINYVNPSANNGDAVFDHSFYIKFYDGIKRATDKGTSGSYWTYIGEDLEDESYQTKTILKAGRGYLLSIPKGEQNSTGHTYRTLRFPMDVASWASETSVNKTVAAAGKSCDWPQHIGWNLIGNPFLQNYSAVTASDLACGKLTKYYNDKDEWVEPWYTLEDGTRTVPYVTIYDPSTDSYTQTEIIGQNISPFSAVFVQLPDGVTGLRFNGTAINKQSIAARRMGLMNSSDETSRFRIMANGKESDQFTLILNDQHTAAYEVGGDLMKMKNEKKINIYTIHEGTEHAFDALSYADGEMIPVGFTQPAAGGIIITARKLQQREDIKHLWLIDNETNTWTDLLIDSYVFTSEAGTFNNRLWLHVETENNIATPITEIGINETDQARKFIYDGQLFIHRGDKLYNAVGTLVK